MNKLAVALFTVLLLCGAFLWFLAPESFNQYIKQEIENTSAQVTEYKVTLEHASIHAEQGIGELHELTLTRKNLSPLLTVNSINIALNPKTLNDNPIVINQLSINGLTLFGAVDEVKEELTSLLEHLASKKILSDLRNNTPLNNIPLNNIPIEASDNAKVRFMVKSIRVENINLYSIAKSSLDGNTVESKVNGAPSETLSIAEFSTVETLDQAGDKVELSRLIYIVILEKILASL